MNSDNEFDEEVEVGEDKPKFVIVELSKLEDLLQRCPDCGKLPSGPKTGKPRTIHWTKNGKFRFIF